MDSGFSLAAVGAGPLLAVAAVAFCASVFGGLSGFGTGLVLPVFLAPVVGVAQVIPVMAVAMLFNNGGRVIAFRREIAWPTARRFLLLGLPACIASAWGYTRLDARAIGIALGLFLLASVPLRRWLRRIDLQLGPRGQLAAGALFGAVNGTLTGAGVLLVAFLMATGAAAAAVVATDATISVLMGVAKVMVFGGFSALDLPLAAFGVAVGVFSLPGAFVARWLVTRLPAPLHAGLIEAVIVAGGTILLWRALAG